MLRAIAGVLALLALVACRGPAGFPDSPLELLPSRATPVPDESDHAAHDLAAAALGGTPGDAQAKLAQLDEVERLRAAAGEAPTGLAGYGQHVVDSTESDPIVYRRRTATLLQRNDVEPALRKQLEQEVEDDPLRLASIRIGESRQARLARDINAFSQAIGTSIMTVALLPLRVAQAALGVAVAEHMDDPISLQERQALAYWKEFVEEKPDAPETQALLARIESMQARWFATKRKQSLRSAQQALNAGQNEIALVLADRALRYAPEDPRASAIRAEAERRVEAHRAELARSLGAPHDPPPDASDDQARSLSVALLDPRGDVDAAARPLLARGREGPLIGEARFATAVSTGERGRESDMWDQMAALGDGDPLTQPMARHARAMEHDADENPYAAFEEARREGREQQASFVLLGSLARGPTHYDLPRPVEWLLVAPSLPGTVTGIASRLIETLSSPPPPAPAIYASRYLERRPEGEHAAEVREWLVAHEEASGHRVRAWEIARDGKGFDEERMADLANGAAEQALETANKVKRRDVRITLLGEIAATFPETEAGKRANRLVHDDLESATAQSIRISKGFLLENPKVAGPSGLALRPELLDGVRANGELHPDGIRLIGGRTLEFSMVAESGNESDTPRLMRETVSPERLARLVSLLEETSQHNGLLDPLAEMTPDPQRDLFFERARLGVADSADDDDPNATSSYAFVGVREKYGLVRPRDSILPVDLVVQGSLPDLGLGAFPRLRAPKETPDAVFYR
ncbi:MAG TPA: hypothetical protein VMH82_03850 [Myxococcota bacterium]|nr:hypothetical protein [Myxococcota bacterium]